jgi:predicted metal-dependent enzyme (double-stranded beta helix superfamily)
MATATRNAAATLPRWLDEHLITASPTSLAQLEEIVAEVGRSPWLWGHAVTFDRERRSHRVLYKTPHLEIALFGWAAGQDTTFHDHGGASGAAFVCRGVLIEEVVEEADGYVIRRRTHERRPESAFSFGPDYIHRVRPDPEQGVALSIHAYTAATAEAFDYDVRPDGTIRVCGESPSARPFTGVVTPK